MVQYNKQQYIFDHKLKGKDSGVLWQLVSDEISQFMRDFLEQGLSFSKDQR